MFLQGKKIVLGVTGSIAAYKIPHFVRLLIKAGAEVKVILTNNAQDFVSPLALATVSKNSVLCTISDASVWNNHVELGLWADVMLIAPCSANTLAKFANGICDNLLTAVYLSARCTVFIAPAMDEDMWKHLATKANLDKVIQYGNKIVPVGHGELASGLVGEGRMAEPEDMLNMLTDFFANTDKPLLGQKTLVTAGPTYERLDPVRFIGNFSTGKMGIAIAESLANKGANVTLVLGPSAFNTTNKNITTIHVESAKEMHTACMEIAEVAHIFVLAAAVADYRPSDIALEKIKKKEERLTITLTKTDDILADIGKIKQPWQTLVGFALETNNELEGARKKLKDKNADIIILNSLKDEGAGFGHDTNKITMLNKNGNSIAYDLQSKKAVAEIIVNNIIKHIHDEKNN